MSFNFSIVKHQIVEKYLFADPSKLFKIIRNAYLLHGQKQSVNPGSYFLKYPSRPDNRIIALPAYLGGDFNVSGIKWIASSPSNVTKGFPRASAVLVLNDYDTGYPFACIESSLISAVRTAVSCVLAAEAINQSREVKNIGFIGNSLIAQTIFQMFHLDNWYFEHIFIYDKNIKQSEHFIDQAKWPKNNICILNSDHELIAKSDMVVFATTAAEPYIFDVDTMQDSAILLNISLRDLGEEVILAANNIVDDVDHVLNANTSVHLAEQKHGNRNFINGTLAELITNKIKLDLNKISVFSPMGMGILDIALGKYIYDMAANENDLVIIDDFFDRDIRN